MESVRSITGRDWAFLGLLTALPLLGYQFGIGSQVEQFPIIGRLSDPKFLEGDFYVDSAAGFGPRYYYSLFISFLTNFGSLPAVILALTCLTNFGVATVTFISARRHFGAGAAAASIAAAFAIVNNSFSLGLAGYIRFESFQPASIAILFSFLGLASLIEGRRLAAAVCFCLSALFHPLVGTEIAMIAYASCAIAELGARRPVVTMLKYFPSGALFAAFIVIVWLLPAAAVESEGLSASEFFAILPSFRSPHHYLAATFPFLHYVAAMAFVAALTLMVWLIRRSGDLDFTKSAYAAAGLIVIVLCALSVFFVDVLHDRLWATAQVFRNLFVLKWIGFLFFASFASAWISTARPAHLTAPMAALIATGDAQPYVMLASILTIWALGKAPQSRRNDVAAAGFIFLSAIGLTFGLGAAEDTSRAIVAAAIVAILHGFRLTLWRRIGIAAALTSALVTIGWFNRKLDCIDLAILQPVYSWADMKGPKVAVARWAKRSAPPDSIWVTPPDLENFRLIAERPVIVDFTSIPFDGGAMREWRRRMEVLYGPTSARGFGALKVMGRNYRSISPEALSKVNAEFGATYAVLYRDTRWNGPVLYENERYKAVRISP